LALDGISADEVEPYLHARAWLADAARLLNRTPEALAAEHTPVAAGSLRVPVAEDRGWFAVAGWRARRGVIDAAPSAPPQAIKISDRRLVSG
jgi:hypothetical protein